MMTVTVQFRRNGSMAEDSWTAPRIEWQIWSSGRGKVTLYGADGALTEDIGYRRIERVRRMQA